MIFFGIGEVISVRKRGALEVFTWNFFGLVRFGFGGEVRGVEAQFASRLDEPYRNAAWRR